MKETPHRRAGEICLDDIINLQKLKNLSCISSIKDRLPDLVVILFKSVLLLIL